MAGGHLSKRPSRPAASNSPPTGWARDDTNRPCATALPGVCRGVSPAGLTRTDDLCVAAGPRRLRPHYTVAPSRTSDPGKPGTA